MAENGGERSFWWNLIKYGAAMVALDHIFPEHQYTEQEKEDIEKNTKINNMRNVISKYNNEIKNLKLKLSDEALKNNIEFKEDILNILMKELKDLINSLQNKEYEKDSIKVFKI